MLLLLKAAFLLDEGETKFFTNLKCNIMKKIQKHQSKRELVRKRWEKRIMREKNYSPQAAKWMAERLEALLKHLCYGHAVIAYFKQNGEFCFVKATLIYYQAEFHKEFDTDKIEAAVVYWDVEQQAWRTFLLENFLEWRPVV